LVFKDGKRKFLTLVLVPLLVNSIGAIPFVGVEKVEPKESSWKPLVLLPTQFYSTLGAAEVNQKI